jgi:hypothetical protein
MLGVVVDITTTACVPSRGRQRHGLAMVARGM